MWLKAGFCVIMATATAMSLLAMRQKRIDLMHDMADHHSQMRQTRQSLWELQVDIADHLNPQSLQAAIARKELELEPVIPLENVQRIATVDSRHSPVAAAETHHE